MHRVEAANNVSNLFTDGPPGTALAAAWHNAVQEELAYLIEQAGITLKTAITDTHTQLHEAIVTFLQDRTIPAGTKMLIYADTAPSGWTIDASLDDKLAFITKGSVAGGQAGGAAHGTGTWTVGGLTKDAHTHSVPSANLDESAADRTVGTDPLASTASGGALRVSTTTGGGRPEYLGKTVAGTSGPQSDDVVSSDGTWRPAAYCFIVCTKDAY